MIVSLQYAIQDFTFTFTYKNLANLEHVLSAEKLHAKQREDDDEEKDEKEQRHDGLHAAQKRQDQVAQRRPVSTGWRTKKNEATLPDSNGVVLNRGKAGR